MSEVQETTPEQGQCGKSLKKARESRNITISTLCKDLKLNQKYVESLEAGRYNELPGDPYVRVYIKTLSKYFNLNTDEILKQFFAERGLEGPDTLKKDATQKLAVIVREKEKPNITLFIALGSILVLSLVLFIGNRNGWFSASEKARQAAFLETDTLNQADLQKNDGDISPVAGAMKNTPNYLNPENTPADTAAEPALKNKDSVQAVIQASKAEQAAPVVTGAQIKQQKALAAADSLKKIKLEKQLKAAAAADSIKKYKQEKQRKDLAIADSLKKAKADKLQKEAALADSLKKLKQEKLKSDSLKTAAAKPDSINMQKRKDSANPALAKVKPKDSVKKEETPPKAEKAKKDSVKTTASVGKLMKVRMQIVKDSVWSQVYTDGVSWRKTLSKGVVRTFTGRDSFNLHIGQSEGVILTVDGNPVPLPEKGVVTLKIDQNGVALWTLDQWNTVFKK